MKKTDPRLLLIWFEADLALNLDEDSIVLGVGVTDQGGFVRFPHPGRKFVLGALRVGRKPIIFPFGADNTGATLALKK